jgi:hypothetical protein
MLTRELNEILKNNSFLIFIDDQLGNSNGYLRSLHLLVRISDNKIRKVVTWEPGRNCNKPLNIFGPQLEFIHPTYFLNVKDVCCVFVNDEREEEYGYVDKYVEFEIPSIFVINHANFIPKAWRLSAKPLESKTQFPPRHFQVELNKYLNSTGLSGYQLTETKNLAFTEICYLHHHLTGERPKTLTELFAFDNDLLAISPIWDWAINLLTLKDENRVTNIYAFIFNAFRPLIERNKDVKKVASIYEDFLKKYHFNIKTLREARNRILKGIFERYKCLLNQTDKDILKSLLQIQMGALQCR